MSLHEALHGRRPWPELKLHGSSWGARRRGRGRERGAGGAPGWGGGRLLGEEAPWGWLLGEAGCPCVLSVCAERLCCSSREEERRKEKGERRGKMKRKRKEKKRKKGKNMEKISNLKISEK
jgi:hypothetical protein